MIGADMELVYLWVEKYKNIHNQGFNFSPRFHCDYDPDTNELTIDENDDYIENFFGDNINVTAIVGKNGSGKSNILEAIAEQNDTQNIFIFSSKDAELYIFTAIQNINILTAFHFYEIGKEQMKKFEVRLGSVLLSIKSSLELSRYSFKDMPRRHLYQFVDKKDFVSDFINVNLDAKLSNKYRIDFKKSIDEPSELGNFDGQVNNIYFEALQSEFLDKILKSHSKIKIFLKNYFKIEEINFKVRSLGEIFYASPDFKDHYTTDPFLIYCFQEYNKEQISIARQLKILCLLYIYLLSDDIKVIINENKPYDINNLCCILKKNSIVKQYISSWKKLIDMGRSSSFDSLYEAYINILHHQNGVKREFLNFEFYPPMSSGQEKLIYLFVNIYNWVEKHNGYYTILIDEPDVFVHPNWQKQVVYLLTEFINTFYSDKDFKLILTTHSPFLLSDIPKQNIIFLDTDEEGKCKVVDGLKEKKQTFGANIHTLLSDSFFMEDGLMGEFAKGKIQQIMNLLNRKPSSYDYKFRYIFTNVYHFDLMSKNIKKVIEAIGEPFLKDKLLKMYEEKYPKTDEDKIQELEAEIERIRSGKNQLQS